MSTIKLKEHLYSVGVLNPSLRVFDIVMEARYGTSYNAYLITGVKNVLVETVHPDYFDEYLQNIETVVPIEKIDCLIMNHTEPDHSGSVARLLERNPQLQVYCTAAAKKYVSAISNREFNCTVVKQGDTLDLGDRTLQFIAAPLLHWPDSMFTWDASSNTLFTCDFLGAHFCEPTMLDTGLHYPVQYLEQLKYYYDCIFGPFKPYVLDGLEKIKDLPVQLVCPSHGPCLIKGIEKAKELYRQWSLPTPRDKKLVGVLYASAYGCTADMARAAADELARDSRIVVKLIDMVFTDLNESVSLVNEADALLVGACTINRDAPKIVWDVLCSIDAINVKRKPAGVFGSYGWSGEAVDMMKSRLELLKFNFIGEALKVNFTPTQADLDSMREYAKEVVSKIKF